MGSLMYSLDEIGLIPTEISGISHRGDVNPFYNGKLPIFVAPMTCILNTNNISDFDNNRVIPILPVTDHPLEERNQLPTDGTWDGWTAVTFDEFKCMFVNCDIPIPKNKKYKILIDTANGHMHELFTCAKEAKVKFGDRLTIMIGNIANPDTYYFCCESGIDYVRVGIGGGSGCTTSVQTGIHASMPWILEGIKDVKHSIAYNNVVFNQKNTFATKVVADGGISTISRAIKCLALGADYVMMGKAFAECEEGSSTGVVLYDKIVDGKFTNKQHLYYGQSSEDGQLDRFGYVKSNPEGTKIWVPVKYTLKEFTDKFEAALRSAMSYGGAHNLEEFIGNVAYKYMSPDEFKAYNK